MDLRNRIPRFSGLPEETLERIRNWAKVREYGTHELILKEGDPPEWLGWILTGKVQIERRVSSRKEILLGVFGAGEAIGEVAILENIPYPATARSMVASSILFLPATLYLHLITADPAFALASLRDLAMRLWYLTRRVHGNAGQAEFRLLRLLFVLACKEGFYRGREIVVPLAFSRKELADLTGLRLETIVRLFTSWKQKGLIVEDGSELRILDLKSFIERGFLTEDESETLARLPKIPLKAPSPES